MKLQHKGYIYLFTRIKDNTPVYIGQHSGYKREYFTSSTILRKLYKTNGEVWFWSYYKKEIIHGNILDTDMLNSLEITYIEKYDTFIGNNPKGYNLTKGGSATGGYKKTEKQIRKGLQQTRNTRIEKGLNLVVLQVNYRGDRIIQEFPSCRAASCAVGVYLGSVSAACKKRIRAGNFYWIYKADYILLKGDIRLYFKKECKVKVDYVRTEEHKKKNSTIHSKAVVQIDKDTDEYLSTFSSGIEAAKCLKFKDSSAISGVCRKYKGGKTAGGFKWMFEKEYLSKNK